MSDEAKSRLQFSMQRSGAKRRGIGWELTFEQWWKIWQDSGHYAERGPAGYVMARHWDSGPYAVGNVDIVTASQNCLAYWARRKARRVRKCPHGMERSYFPDPLEILIAREEGDEEIAA